jgi:hypothetical protein
MRIVPLPAQRRHFSFSTKPEPLQAAQVATG